MRSFVACSLLLLGLLCAATAEAQRVSLVWDGDHDDADGTISTDTYARRHALESLGFPVRFENPNNSESWYDTYGATKLYDVIYVSGESGVALLGDKLRDHQTAVIYETPEMDAAFGLSTTVGSATDGTQIEIDTLGHAVTATSFLGSANLYTSANPISVLQGMPAASLQGLASQGGATCLAVVEAGGTLANTIDGNATATKRRVRLPFGAEGTNWSEVTGATLELMEQAVVWASAPDYTRSATPGILVMLTADNGVLNDEETWRVRRLTYDGWVVVLIWDGDSQANYDTAIAAADVVYVTTETDATDVGDKLRTATCGVVYENNELDDNLGLATGGGIRTVSTGFYTRDRGHPVTANMYLDEYVSCFYRFDYAAGNHPGENQELGRMSGTLAPDLRVLGTRWSEPVLAIVDSGDQLANNVAGNDTAAGRRVRLPWVGDADLSTMPSWAEGSQVWNAALRWAAGTQTGSLIAHYKLDETSGTTAADSSGNGYDGEYRGGITQSITPAPRNVAANFDAVGEYVYTAGNSDFANLAANNADFTIAFWIRPHAVTHAEWRNLFHIGGASSSDRGPLIMLHPTLRRFYCWVSTTTIASGTGGYSSFEVDNEEWVHVTVVKSASSMRWYLNGEFVNAHAINGESVATQGDLRIGEESWWGRPDADLDDLRVYSYAISDQEIAELHADLVLHYKLDEGSGTVVNDSSVFGNDGAFQGSPIWSADTPIEGGLDFDVADGADRVEGPALDVGDDGITMAVWFNQRTPSNDARLLANTSGNSSSQQSWLLTVDESGNLDCRVRAGGSRDKLEASGVISPGGWHHAAATYDGAEMRLYLDGILIAQKTHSVGGPIDFDPTHQVTLGDSFTGGRSFDGKLDDARVYRRTLTDAEVFELGGNGLRLHLRLEETSGTVASDSSPFGNDGTHIDMGSMGEEAVIEQGASYSNSGAEDRTDVPHAVVDGLDAITVAWWMKTEKTGEQAVLSGARSGGANSLLVYFANDTTFRLYVNEQNMAWSIASIADGRWRHFSITYNGSDGATELFIDGVSQGLRAHPRQAILDIDSGGLLIGQEQDSVGGGFVSSQQLDATLDDFRVYSRVLSAEEVTYLYGLIGHWRLDEIAGDTVAVDETVFAQDGAYRAAPALEEESPYPSDAVRTAARFEPGDFVQIPAAEHLEVGTDNADFSVAYWLRNNREASGQWREVVKKHTNGRERTFAMWLRPDDERLHVRISTDHSWNEGTDTISVFDPGVWRHVVYVKRDSQLQVYVDGVLDRSVNLNGAVYSNNGNVHFGVRGTGWRSDVSIDDFRVYSRALNDWEVAELHGLVGWYRMEDMAGTVAIDSSGMKNHGVVYGNTPSWPLDAREGSGSIELDGTNYIQTQERPLDGPGAALSGWAKLVKTDAYGSEVVSLGDSLAIRLDSPFLGGAYAFGYNGTSWESTPSGRTFKDTGWSHFATSYRSDLRELAFYIDGVLVGSQVLVSDLDLTSLGSTITIGDHGDAKPFYKYTGQLDDVRIYNRPISRAEARGLYYGDQVPGLRIVNWREVPNP